MKRYRFLLIALGIILVLAGLTFYLNRIVFPNFLKKTVITQAEQFLKRKVELDTIHFNWVKGFIIERVKIYQKDSPQVFLQAERISLGLIFIPGFKRHQINIPFINIENPSAHLTRNAPDQWNFSDLLTPAAPDQPLPFAVSVAGCAMTGGKIRVDDISDNRNWTQLVEHLDLKVSLSYKGFPFSLSFNIPKGHGTFVADGVFQPLTQNVQAHVRIKNISAPDYLFLAPAINGFELKDALVQDIDLNLSLNKNLMTASGNAAIKDLQASLNGQSINGSFSAVIQNARFENDSLNLAGDLTANGLEVAIAPGKTITGNILLDKVKARHSKEGTEVTGTLNASNLDIQGDILSFTGGLALNDFNLHLINQKDATLTGKLSLTNMAATFIKDKHLTGSIELPSLAVHLAQDTLDIKTQGELNNCLVNLGPDQSIVAEASFVLDAVYPLKTPEQLSYQGSLTIHNAEANGFPFGPFKEVRLKSEFKTDTATLQSFSFVAMDTSIRGSGSLLNFRAPVLNVDVASEKIDLSRLQTVLPRIFSEYGLKTNGEASFNGSFQGLLSDPLSGRIKASALLRNASLSSSKFKQSISQVSGSIEGSPDTAKWNNFTGTYLGKPYTLTGELNDFKNPQVKTSLSGEDVELNADLSMKDKALTITTLKGKYLDFAFDVTGQVKLPEGAVPVLDIIGKVSTRAQDLLPYLPAEQRQIIAPLKPSGQLDIEAAIKGAATDWQHWTSTARITSPLLFAMGYSVNDAVISLAQRDGEVTNLTVDATSYDGKIHAVASGSVVKESMPFDLAMNIDNLDLHKLKTDIPELKSEEINGRLYLTFVGKGNVSDIRNLKGKGSLAIREGFLTEFKMFKGILGIINEVLRLGQVMITDVEGNFTVEQQKIATDNLRLKSPTIVLVTEGWVNFDLYCDLKVLVDMSSGIIPPIALEVLRSLEIHLTEKITDPKFSKRISVPQVINSIIRTIGIFQ